MSETAFKRKIALITLGVLFLIIGGFIGISAIFGSNADQVENSDSKEIVSTYSDDEYGGEPVVDIDNEDVQDILECYDKGNLSMNVGDEKIISYTVDSDAKDSIDDVEGAVCIEKAYNTDSDEDEKAVLYLTSAKNCTYNKSSGEITAKFECKLLLLNNVQPMASYLVGKDGDNVLYKTPVFIEDNSDSSMLLLSVDDKGDVKIQGEYVENDEEGNPLSEVQVRNLENGTEICPAYENFVLKKALLDDKNVNANEVYEIDQAFKIGENFDLSYVDAPDGNYLYNFKIKYNKDSDENVYCMYTDQQSVTLESNKVGNVEEAKIEPVNINDYIECGAVKFLKIVWKHYKGVPKDERKQMFEHKINNEERGYISTWNSLNINKKLRTDKYDELEDDDKLTVDILQKHCLNNVADDNYIALRNVSADFFTTIFGIEYNGEKLSDELVKRMGDEKCIELEERLQKEIVGKKVLEKGFMSVSLVPAVNIVFGRKIKINVLIPKGSKYYVTNNIVESEAIFPRNTSLVINSVNYDTKKDKFVINAVIDQSAVE